MTGTVVDIARDERKQGKRNARPKAHRRLRVSKASAVMEDPQAKLMGDWRCEEDNLWEPPEDAHPPEDSWEEMKVRKIPESGDGARKKILFRRKVDWEDLDLEAVRQKEHPRCNMEGEKKCHLPS